MLPPLAHRFPTLRRLATALAGFALLQALAVPAAGACPVTHPETAIGGVMDSSHESMADHAGSPDGPLQPGCPECGTDACRTSSASCAPECSAMVGCTALFFLEHLESGSLLPRAQDRALVQSQHALSRSAAPELPPPRA